MIAETIPAIGKLTREEKLLLATELWQECVEIERNPDRDAAIEKLLKLRWEEYKKDPENVISWDDMKAKYGLDRDE